MKLTNILSIICIFVTLVSCSMNEDIIDNTNKDVVVEAEVNAAFNFNLTTAADLNTKTVISGPTEDSDYQEMTADEKSIGECFVFVVNGDKIIGRRHYTSRDITKGSNDHSYTLNKNIMVKVSAGKPALTVYAVGMKSDTENYFEKNIFYQFDSFEALKAVECKSALTDFIKVGVGTITEYNTSTSTTVFEAARVDLKLTLRTAAIQLNSFIVKDARGNVLNNASVKNISFTNQKMNTVLDPNGTEVKVGTNYETVKDQASNHRFYTYENHEYENWITINYIVDGVEAATHFMVKTTTSDFGIYANYLYKLNVTITNGVTDVTFDVAGWQENHLGGNWNEITD